MTNYRDKLFASYHSTHVAYLDSDDRAKLEWFRKYVKKHYLPVINSIERGSSMILEIGCNKGYMLYVLNASGFKNLYGIDLSPEDIEIAKKIVPDANLYCTDAFDYLDKNVGQFDVIILKAVLEHVQKNQILIFLEKIKEGLKPGGLVLIDVPNMDWLFASHERYMDFTHEVGFTKESLMQILNNAFTNVSVEPIDNFIDSSLFSNFKKRFARYVLGLFFSWADPEGASNPIWARSIIGVGKK